MAVCEKCWREANHRAALLGGDVTHHYGALLLERKCDEEEQKYGEHLCAGCGRPESDCSCCGRCGHPNCGCDYEVLSRWRGRLMANPDIAFGALQKPVKGSTYMASKDRRATRREAEQAELQAALKRDGRKCRFPGCTGRYRGLELPIDPCHMTQPDGTKHRAMGGNPDGTATRRAWVCALCRRHHTLYDAGEIDAQPVTDAGFDGMAAWYQKHPETGAMEPVATETTHGISEARR